MGDWDHAELADMEEYIKELEQKVTELTDPGWETYIEITQQWLTHYPDHIFDGSSGDKGPLFVVAVRVALAALIQESE